MTKLGNVPLTAVDFKKQTATNIVIRWLEGFVERAARRDDSLILVEYYERIANCINNRVCKGKRDRDRNGGQRPVPNKCGR